MTATLPILEDDVVRLEPFGMKDDIERVLDIVMKCPYTRLSREKAREALLKYETVSWHCYDKKTGIMGGIVYLTHAEKYWTLDAYKDDVLMKQIDNAMDYSFRVGKLVSDYAMTFISILLTCHAFENRGATIVCKKLGFKEDFIVLKKEKIYGN